MTDVRDPSALPPRQPGADVPPGRSGLGPPGRPGFDSPDRPGFDQPGPAGYRAPPSSGYGEPDPVSYRKPDPVSYREPDPVSYREPDRAGYGEPDPPGRGQPETDPLARRQPGTGPQPRLPGGSPARRPHAQLVAPGGRHRRPVPASLPEGAPAFILAVPSASDDGLAGPTAEIATVLRVDNPALDVRTARICGGGRGDPSGIRAVLADAAARRPAGAPAAVVVPQLVTPHPDSIRALREAIAASGANAHIGEVFNTNALLAEALHHRLADAGLARADRVRMFSITTSADGIILATVGGQEAVGTASVTAFLLAARLALPVLAASLDGAPSVGEAAASLVGMGVTRIALAPYVIGPEADPAAISEAAAVVGAKCSAPLGAHSNVIKLLSLAYGQVLSQLEAPVGS